jgi:outer membrane beta-barrel protein
MTMTNSMPSRLALVASRLVGPLALLAVTLAPTAAHAQRKSPLEDAPAIRKRLELRETRFEAGVGFGSTINQDFYHTLMLDVRLAFHINDWLSIAGVGGFAVDNMETGFQERVLGTLPATGITREPTKAVAQASMSKIDMALAGQLEFTPFTGKYSLFGKIFAHYDFYAFGGVGALKIEPTGTVPDCGSAMATQSSCGVSGYKPGANVGLGLHTFFNEWVGLNVELRDIIAQINPSGRDVNGDGIANSADLTWGSTYMATANLVIYLPSTAAISQ